MKYFILSGRFSGVITCIFFCMIFFSCQKESQDDYPFPSVVTIKLNEGSVFDATENQIISLDTNEFTMDFKIVSLINTLCPEGATCIMHGSAFLKIKSIMQDASGDTLSLQYPSIGNSIDFTDSDSVYFNYRNKRYLIRLLRVRKVFNDERKTNTRSIIDMEIKDM